MIPILAAGLPDFQRYVDAAPGIAVRAARMAVNDTTNRLAVNAVRDAMLEQVAFPLGYLQEPRYGVSQQATDLNLTAAISGRRTPTSLARFAISGSVGLSHIPIRVEVKPHHIQQLDHAFLLRLKGSDGLSNVGLAIRLKQGQRILNKYAFKPYKTGSGVYLLYGPSVDQVFGSAADVATPAILAELETQFLRQFIRLS